MLDSDSVRDVSTIPLLPRHLSKRGRGPDDLPGTLEFDASEKEALEKWRTMLPALGFSKPDLNPSLPRASI